MSKEHYNVLRDAISKLDTELNRGYYRSGNYPRADRTKDVNKRYRWDLLHVAKIDVSELYKYLNDDHIDTALKAIVKVL